VWQKRSAHGVLVGKPEVKRPLGRPKHRRKDSIKWVFGGWNGRA